MKKPPIGHLKLIHASQSKLQDLAALATEHGRVAHVYVDWLISHEV